MPAERAVWEPATAQPQGPRWHAVARPAVWLIGWWPVATPCTRTVWNLATRTLSGTDDTFRGLACGAATVQLGL